MRSRVEIPSNISMPTLLRRSMTTREDLERLLKHLNLDGTVDWSVDFNKNQPRQILNLGNGLMGGTHWVAVDNINKRYFDSFGQVPPPMIPKDYEWMPLDIQDVRYGHCGQYCALFLFYSKDNNIDSFYKSFRENALDNEI